MGPILLNINEINILNIINKINKYAVVLLLK